MFGQALEKPVRRLLDDAEIKSIDYLAASHEFDYPLVESKKTLMVA